MFILGEGVVAHPHVCTPPVHLYTPIHLYAPICLYTPLGVYTPQGPHASVLLHGFGTLHVVGGCFLFYVYWDTPPLFGGASPLITPPHSIVGSLCIVILRDISSYVGLSPSIEGFGGVPPSLGRFWGDTSAAVHMLILLHLFCSALCLMTQPWLRLLLLQLQWYLLACHQCHQYQWLLL